MKPEILHVCPNCKYTSIGMQRELLQEPVIMFPAASSDNHNDLCPACFWKTRLEILIDAINNDHAFKETHGILKAFDVAQSQLNAMKNQLKAYHDRR